jgi:ATP-dependent DNA helicase RecG
MKRKNAWAAWLHPLCETNLANNTFVKLKAMNLRKGDNHEKEQILKLSEDHFNDLKSKRINPAKLQQTFVAFANADGGNIYIGVEDEKISGNRCIGFNKVEDANNIIHTLLEQTKPAVENVEVEFIEFTDCGLVLNISIPKSPKVHYTANDECFLRINARKEKIKGERITQLGYAKGAYVYEKQPVDIAELDDYIDSDSVKAYMRKIESRLDVARFLRKQRLLTKKDGNYEPNVACVLLFDDEPQATLPTRCAIKVYRLRTTDEEYKREHLLDHPSTINGPVEQQIKLAINKINELLKDATVSMDGKLEKLNYPSKTIHEILVNSVIHRDYSLNDDIHVRIYDNRIEVVSPGKLPGYITVGNIYDERFSRNPNLVRMLHNLPNPVNHDIGEGLDTARNEMNKAGLVDPEIHELDNAVKIIIRHKKIQSVIDSIIKYLEKNPTTEITNRKIRELTGEDDVNKVKGAFQKLRKMNIIEPVDPDANPFDFKYRLKK